MGLSSTGEVYTWEYLQGPEDNALLTPPACKRALDGKNVVDIGCGGNVRDASDVYLALTDKGEVYSWGAGDFRRPLVLPAEHKNRMPRVIDQLRVCNRSIISNLFIHDIDSDNKTEYIFYVLRD